MDIVNLFKSNEKIGILGLGYVGLPLAVAFSKHYNVIGLDINHNKIESYKNGIDSTKEVGNENLKKAEIEYTSDMRKLEECKFIIITVPTPIRSDKSPDLDPIIGATESIAKYIKKGTYVVYESTVYPGVTEDVCIPLISEISGLTTGSEFYVGYSPERINPGDEINKVESIVKIVSGMNQKVTNDIASIYSEVIHAGVHMAPSIKVAEAAKVLENSQRDINIAFMNEVSLILDKMNVNTFDVLEAMNTKWNALGFYPGLVGGHCIGVDPYYFIYKAEQLGYHSQIVSAGRKINDSMPRFITESLIKEMIKKDFKIQNSKVLIFGITFKEDTPDVRNSKVIEIIELLKEYNIDIYIVDDNADFTEMESRNTFTIIKPSELDRYKQNFNSIIYAVNHKTFEDITIYEELLLKDGLIFDLKNKFKSEENIWKL